MQACRIYSTFSFAKMSLAARWRLLMIIDLIVVRSWRKNPDPPLGRSSPRQGEARQHPAPWQPLDKRLRTPQSPCLLTPRLLPAGPRDVRHTRPPSHCITCRCLAWTHTTTPEPRGNASITYGIFHRLKIRPFRTRGLCGDRWA